MRECYERAYWLVPGQLNTASAPLCAAQARLALPVQFAHCQCHVQGLCSTNLTARKEPYIVHGFLLGRCKIECNEQISKGPTHGPLKTVDLGLCNGAHLLVVECSNAVESLLVGVKLDERNLFADSIVIEEHSAGLHIAVLLQEGVL